MSTCSRLVVSARLACFSLLACAAAHAQDSSDAPTAPIADKARTSHATFAVDAFHIFSSDLEQNSGSVAVTRAGADVGTEFPIGERSNLTLSFGAEHSWYSWDNVTGFGASSEPWDNVLELSAALGWRQQIDDHWTWFAGAGVNSSAQLGAEFDDSLTFVGNAGAIYAWNERFAAGLGVAVLTRLEDDVLVLPVPVVRWQLAERWSLETGSVRRGRDFGLVLGYQITDAVRISLAGGYSAREFRLDEDAGSPMGIGRDARVPIILDVAWKVDPQITLGAFAGAVFAQRYELDDTSGNEVADRDADASFMAGVGAKFEF